MTPSTERNAQMTTAPFDARVAALDAGALPALSCGKVDLGIARLHFELGANALSRDWAFER